MLITDLGLHPKIKIFMEEHGLSDNDVGRVMAEHKERYIVFTIAGEMDAEVTGHLRFNAASREDFPGVGDWVEVTPYEAGSAIIHRVLPRQSAIKRQAVGKHSETQLIACNIDYGMIVQAADRDFNINRLERYLTICHASKISPIIVLSKIDLISREELEMIKVSILSRINEIPVYAFSNESMEGFEAIRSMIEKGKTYCLLGSSGVGKSTLVNKLTGEKLMKTGQISDSTGKGRHVTSHRELFVLDNGGIIIDNPGMREVGIADSSTGLETTFDKIMMLADECRFKDCTHTTESECRVLDAVENGEIDWKSYQNYLKLEREKNHFESTLAEKRQKEKTFGKMLREYKKNFYDGRFKK
jgi:ribosome biogenesis GTPase / thiamine phosphate phosphatase